MSATADEEAKLKVELMRADIANKQADTDYKRGLLRFEPWKIVVGAFATGAAVVGAMVAFESYFNPRSSSAPIYQLPPGTVITVPK
jgi:hypothetical protein